MGAAHLPLRDWPDASIGAQTNYLCVRTMRDGERNLFSVGRYHDSLVFEAGKAKLRSRLVIADLNQIDTLPVISI
jgi:3-phenylpropionate/cinnamic acid dioxygenase small subunit